MKLDRNAVERLLALNDAQLQAVIMQLAGENGIDLAGFPIRPSDMEGVRRALRLATDDDIKRAAEQLGHVRRREE